MTTIRIECDSYISEYTNPADLIAGKLHTVAGLYHLLPGSTYKPSGYTKVGTSVIEFNRADEVEIVTAKVAALRAQQQETRAEAEKKCRVWDDQIGKLLALTNEVAA